MTSRTAALGTLLLTIALVVSGCGGDPKPSKPAGPDESNFVPITAKGVAALVHKHLGGSAKGYTVLTDEPSGKFAERTIEVTLKGEDDRDSFTVSVYPENGSQGQVAKGSCADSGNQSDPQTKVSCASAPWGGNVTITHFSFGLSGGKNGSYLTASGTGPTSREATAEYDGFTHTIPVTDAQLRALLGDPNLGWKTDPKVNKAGEAMKVATD